MKSVLAFAACAASSDASVLRGQRQRAHMQPEVVAASLRKVEDNWRSEALDFAQCNATQGEDCSRMSERFVESCTTLVGVVVKASNGDRSVVKEYMGDICAEPALDGWHRGSCSEIAAAMVSTMDADSFVNREGIKSKALCDNLWSRFSAEQQVLYEKERVAREEAERKAEAERAEKEEAERKAAAELAEKEAAERARVEKEVEDQKKAEAEIEAEAAKHKAVEQAALSSNVSSASNASDTVAEAAPVNSSTQTNVTVDSTSVANATVTAVGVNSTSDVNASDVSAMADQIAANATSNSTVAANASGSQNQTNSTVAAAPVDAVVAAASNTSAASVVANTTQTVNASTA